MYLRDTSSTTTGLLGLKFAEGQQVGTQLFGGGKLAQDK